MKNHHRNAASGARITSEFPSRVFFRPLFPNVSLVPPGSSRALMAAGYSAAIRHQRVHATRQAKERYHRVQCVYTRHVRRMGRGGWPSSLRRIFRTKLRWGARGRTRPPGGANESRPAQDIMMKGVWGAGGGLWVCRLYPAPALPPRTCSHLR